jgi:hypothetical protein
MADLFGVPSPWPTLPYLSVKDVVNLFDASESSVFTPSVVCVVININETKTNYGNYQAYQM